MKNITKLLLTLLGMALSTPAHALIEITGMRHASVPGNAQGEIDLFNVTQLGAQYPFTLQLLAQAPDTASNVFSQNKYLLKFKEHIPFVIDTSDFLHLETSEPLYDVKFLADSSFLTVKFPNSGWICLREDEHVPFYDKSPQTLFTYPTDRGEIFLELITIFDKYPDLFEQAKVGCNIEIRYQLYLSMDGGAYHYIYSNTETMYLPPATTDDIQAFQFIREKFKSVRRFAYYSGVGMEHLEDCNYLRSQFPSSIISDLATKNIIHNGFVTKSYAGETDSEIRLWVKEQYKTLLNSKSDLVRSEADMKVNK